MKGIIIFFDDINSKYSDEAVFGEKKIGGIFADGISPDEKSLGGKTAINLAEKWALDLKLENATVSQKDFSSEPTLLDLLLKMKEISDEACCDYVIFTYKDLPFLKKSLTEKMMENHEKYQAEYTFSDGFPYGFAPEIIDCGCLNILIELLKSTKSDFADNPVSRDCIHELIKSDINSFEVETVLSDSDWRLFRFAFHCGKKENFVACKALFNAVQKQGKTMDDYDAEELSKIASGYEGVLKTVPGFYNFQICDFTGENKIYSPYCKCYGEKFNESPMDSKEIMDYEKFSKIIDEIAVFSENAVIGLSAWGEALHHPRILDFIEKVLSYKGLSVFIETDGKYADDEFCEGLKKIVGSAEERSNGWGKVMIALSFDAVTDETYAMIHRPEDSSSMCGENARNFLEKDGKVSVSEKNAISKTKNQNEGMSGNPKIESLIEICKKLEDANPKNVYPQFVRINENEKELESFFRFWNDKNNITGGRFIIEKYNDFSKFLPECKPADLSPLERNVCWHLRRDITILSNGDVPACYNCMLGEIVGNVFEEGIESIWKKTDGLLKAHLEEKYNERCRNCDEFYTFNF